MLLLDRAEWIVTVIVWIIVLTDAATDQSATRRYAATSLRRPITRQIVAQCAVPYFPNGEAKIRNRGRMMRFDCSYGYKLVGNRYSNCNNGRWDTSIPVCVKSGCETLPQVESGYVLYEMNRATAWLSCFDGTELAGSRNTYCNGTHWDRPLGVCRRTGQVTATGCDFETESLCGWTNDVLHDFDWKRSDGTLNPRALRTGPKYDHTKMQPKAGHFMIVDSAEQLTNDTARFISPMFEPEFSNGACFQFYYHMYGESVGLLNVYVKPMTSDLYDLKPLFAQQGNQKNVWHEGHIDIPQQSERFQIVFEASLGLRYKSDIALDDVNLLQGDSCKVAVEDGLENPDEVPTDPEKVPVKIESCENRCGSSMAAILNSSDTIVHCDCHEDCVTTETCCPDYRERCVFEVVLPENITTVSTTTSAPVTRSTLATNITVKLVSTTPIVVTTSSTTTTATTTTTTARVTAKATTTTIATTKARTIARTTPTSTVSTSTTKPPLVPHYVPLTTRPRINMSTSTKQPVSPSTQASTVVPTRKAVATTTQSDMVFETTDVDASTDASLASGLALAPFPTETVQRPSMMKFFLCAIGGVIVFVGIICVTHNYARRSRSSVLARLKEKSQKKCFEDIRFLAGDEDLDFNISQGSEAVEEEKNNSPKKSAKMSKDIKQDPADNHIKNEANIDKCYSQQPAATVADRAQDNGDDNDDDGENDSTDDEGNNGNAANGTNIKSTKKAYQKYVKYYDEDMTSTLL